MALMNGMASLGATFFGSLMKIEVHCTLIWEIKLLETSLAQGDTLGIVLTPISCPWTISFGFTRL